MKQNGIVESITQIFKPMIENYPYDGIHDMLEINRFTIMALLNRIEELENETNDETK